MTLNLEPIKERRRRITPGPWTRDGHWVMTTTPVVEQTTADMIADCTPFCEEEAADKWPSNADFIANAPTDIDALIAEVERSRPSSTTVYYEFRGTGAQP